MFKASNICYISRAQQIKYSTIEYTFQKNPFRLFKANFEEDKLVGL